MELDSKINEFRKKGARAYLLTMEERTEESCVRVPAQHRSFHLDFSHLLVLT